MALATDAQIQEFVAANINDPQAIANASAIYGVSTEDLSRATGYSQSDVNSYFAGAGIKDSPSAISDTTIGGFVGKNIQNPQAIANAAIANRVSKVDLMRATGYSVEEINKYFENAGIVNKPATATAAQLSATSKSLGLDPVVTILRDAGLAQDEINSFLEQATVENTQYLVDQFNSNKKFSEIQAELDAMSQQEIDEIKRQQAEFDAFQQRLAEQAALQAEQVRAEQERLAAEAAAYKKQAEEKAAQAKKEKEDFQRTTAEREVARKRAGRSAIARPLLAGAGMTDAAPTLGIGGGMTTGQSLGTTGTLGVGG